MRSKEPYSFGAPTGGCHTERTDPANQYPRFGTVWIWHVPSLYFDSALRSEETWTVRLPSSTTASGHTRFSRSSLRTTLPAFATSTERISSAFGGRSMSVEPRASVRLTGSKRRPSNSNNCCSELFLLLSSYWSITARGLQRGGLGIP